MGPICHGQFGNGTSIIIGVANHSRATSALDYITHHALLHYGNAFFNNGSLGANIFSECVYSSHTLKSKLNLLGMPDSALDEINRLCGWMADKDPKTKFWEGIRA